MPSLIIELAVAALLLGAPEAASPGAVAVAGNPPAIYRLIPADQNLSAIVAYGQDPSGEAVARWQLGVEGRLLAVTRDAGRACVVGMKPSTGRRRGDDGTRPWTLTVLNLASGQSTAPMPLGIVPSSATLLGAPGSEPKLLIGTTGRIAAYSLEPPRTSWFYTSPGDNSAIAAGGAGVVAVLRGSTLAIIDPARRPRIEGRLQLTDDDATSSIDLGGPGVSLAMSDDGAVAAVLHDDDLTLSLIDVGAGKVMERRRLTGPADASVMTIVTAAETGYRLMVARVSPLPSMAAIDIAAPEKVIAQAPVPQPAEPEPPPPPPAVTPAEPAPMPTPDQEPGDGREKTPDGREKTPDADRKEAPGDQPDAEPREAPENLPESEEKKEPEGAPDARPVPEPQPQSPQEPAPPSEPPPLPVQESPQEPAPAPDAARPPEPPRPSDDAALSGTISGETAAAKEVRFYGPNNILKLHARSPVSPDGTFRIALPPAGSYRVVVTGDPGAHLFTHPEFRMVVVGPDGRGVSGIDFEVRGRL